MPCLDIVIESPIQSSFRVEQVRGMFDVPDQKIIRHEWKVKIPIEEFPWQIGLIVGPSGSGKTTIGQRAFPDALFHTGYRWPDTAAIVDGFPKGIDGKDITQALSSVGFSSPPHWLKRYAHLSNGQKFRCELARLMLEDAVTVVFDEFTSIVDRDAAKISSAAVAKALRNRGKPQLVALSCHYDIIDWLDPDWVYNTADGAFARRSLRCRPPIQLHIHAATTAAWNVFSGHHYLTRSLNRAARCFVATWNDIPVAFTSYLHQATRCAVQDMKREHRTVVLPDYQGVGIGNKLSEWLGAYLKGQGWRFRSVTSHPSMIRHRCKSKNWRCCFVGHVMWSKTKHKTLQHMRRTSSASRITGTFEYIGPALSSALAADSPHRNSTIVSEMLLCNDSVSQ